MEETMYRVEIYTNGFIKNTKNFWALTDEEVKEQVTKRLTELKNYYTKAELSAVITTVTEKYETRHVGEVTIS